MLNRIRPWQGSGVVIAALLLLFILASCGKKGPPLPPVEQEGAEAPALINTNNNAQPA